MLQKLSPKLMRNLLKFIIFSTFTPTANALPFVSQGPITRFVTVVPVEDLSYNEDGLVSVTYELPCNHDFLGFVTRQIAGSAPKAKPSLRIAIGLRAPKVFCATLPVLVTVVAPFIDSTLYNDIKPATSEQLTRLTILETDAIVVNSKASSSPASVNVTYNSRCGNFFGTLIRPVSSSLYEIAPIERRTETLATKQCNSSPRQVIVGGLSTNRSKEKFRVRPFEVNVGDLERAYSIHVMPVDFTNSKALPSGGYNLAYIRQCNDAPIAVIINGTLQNANRINTETSLKKIRIGLLVARFDNLACPSGMALQVHDSFVSKDLDLPQGALLSAFSTMATKPDTKLKLTSPSQYGLLSKNRKAGLALDFKGTCSQPIGAALARDASGNLAVAVVEIQSPDSRPDNLCKLRDKQVSFVQPFAKKAHDVAAIYPLQLNGLADDEVNSSTTWTL